MSLRTPWASIGLQIPSPDPLNPGWVYNDGDEFANVNVFIRTYINKPNIRYYTPVFSLDVYTPSQVEFKDIVLSSWGEDSQLNRCGFPNTQGWQMPFCLEAFLNQPHPASGYKRILLLHEGLCCATQEEADFTLMGIGDRKVMRLHGYIEGQNIYGDCDELNPYDQHCVYLKARGYGETPNDYDIYLERSDTNVWKVVVCTQFNNPERSNFYPDAFDYQDDEIFTEYGDCVPTKIKNRIVDKKVIQHPAWARGSVAYEILFIRSQQ